MTDKEKIREEVERLKKWQPIASPSLKKLLSFIDSMQEEPVSEDLEKEIDRYWKNAPTGTLYFPQWEHFQNIARHFADWQKQRMMKEAVESKVTITSKDILLEDLRIEDFDYEDKVKLIIIKED